MTHLPAYDVDPDNYDHHFQWCRFRMRDIQKSAARFEAEQPITILEIESMSLKVRLLLEQTALMARSGFRLMKQLSKEEQKQYNPKDILREASTATPTAHFVSLKKFEASKAADDTIKFDLEWGETFIFPTSEMIKLYGEIGNLTHVTEQRRTSDNVGQLLDRVYAFARTHQPLFQRHVFFRDDTRMQGIWIACGEDDSGRYRFLENSPEGMTARTPLAIELLGRSVGRS